MSGLAVLELVDRYGPAIEWDLHERLGVDLLDFFRGVHPWRKLQRLLDQLGKIDGTALWAARADDDHLAAAYLEAHPELLREDGPAKPAPPPLRSMDMHTQLLLGLHDMVGLVVDTLAQLGGGTPQMSPAPRPTTALTRAKAKTKARKMNALLAEALEAQARN